VLRKVLKIEIREFPSVFECSRVLNFAINAHEIICLQPLSLTVTAEAGRIIPGKRPFRRDGFSIYAKSTPSRSENPPVGGA
jgi:hypothetical protein